VIFLLDKECFWSPYGLFQGCECGFWPGGVGKLWRVDGDGEICLDRCRGKVDGGGWIGYLGAPKEVPGRRACSWNERHMGIGLVDFS